ncbi:hypothetical protein GCM10027271_40080 [Saccharopolyspora gloriosae]
MRVMGSAARTAIRTGFREGRLAWSSTGGASRSICVVIAHPPNLNCEWWTGSARLDAAPDPYVHHRVSDEVGVEVARGGEAAGFPSQLFGQRGQATVHRSRGAPGKEPAPVRPFWSGGVPVRSSVRADGG